MIKVPSLALLIAGVLSLADGLSAATGASSSFGQVADTPGTAGLVLIAGGIVAVIAGGYGLNHCKAP